MLAGIYEKVEGIFWTGIAEFFDCRGVDCHCCREVVGCDAVPSFGIGDVAFQEFGIVCVDCFIRSFIPLPVPLDVSEDLGAGFVVLVVDLARAFFVVDFAGAFFGVTFVVLAEAAALSEAGDDVKKDRISDDDFASFTGRVDWFSWSSSRLKAWRLLFVVRTMIGIGEGE